MRRLQGRCSSGWASVSLATRGWQRPHLFSYKQGLAPPPDRNQSPGPNLAAVDPTPKEVGRISQLTLEDGTVRLSQLVGFTLEAAVTGDLELFDGEEGVARPC